MARFEVYATDGSGLAMRRAVTATSEAEARRIALELGATEVTRVLPEGWEVVSEPAAAPPAASARRIALGVFEGGLYLIGAAYLFWGLLMRLWVFDMERSGELLTSRLMQISRNSMLMPSMKALWWLLLIAMPAWFLRKRLLRFVRTRFGGPGHERSVRNVPDLPADPWVRSH
ncbi:MAG: hypothetical protein RBS39_12890 [Phycisphaerales bacterium]|jgi:hypothetical protein|nr:hypothetical protein [Phycisphaerales bacterium]